jgi:transglutaminase-like putative cysteine protease
MSAPKQVELTSGGQLAVGASSRRGGHPMPSTGLRIVTTLLLFGLFGEWLYPLYTMMPETQTGLIPLFFVLTGALLLLGCLGLPSGLFAPLPPLLIAGAMLYLYGRGEGIAWFVGYAQTIVADLEEFLGSGRLYAISMETRALLLLIGWTLLVVSVQMLALSRQSILLFLSATVIYLLVLEAAVGTELYLGVIRSAALGLALQAAAFHRGESGPNRGSGSVAGGSVVLVCVAGAALLSSLLPLQPVRAISWEQVARSLSEWSGAELTSQPGGAAAVSVSGYGRDDSKLGGPLRLRHDPYFTALSPYNTYWRGESKSVYTGRGWIQPAGEGVPAIAGAERPGPGAGSGAADGLAGEAAAAVAGVDTGRELIRQTLTFEAPLTGRVALLSGGLPVQAERIIAGDGNVPVQIDPRFDAWADALIVDYAAPAEQIYGYELTSAVPTSSAAELHQEEGPDPTEVRDRFLQLPDALPERVRKLGEQLVAAENSRYDAAAAVESYLKHRYAYSLDAHQPPEGADFVDRFLFVDRIGYCDHFSTAMVVLLRSGGVPARWVKGFAPGDPVSSTAAVAGETDGGVIPASTASGTGSTELRRYTVTYADAHSWVEVYFPETGWVAFDPTPGFGESMALSVSTLVDHGIGGVDAEAAFPLLAKATEVAKLLQPQLTELVTKELAGMKPRLRPLDWAVLALSVGFILLLARETRRYSHVLPLAFDRLRIRSAFPGRRELLAAADRVWRELALVYGPKPAALTPREYIESAITGDPAQAEFAEQFVWTWERIYYGGLRPERKESVKFLELCRKLAFRRR